MALSTLEDARADRDAARFGIRRSKIEPRNARMGNCACTHSARFKRYIEIAPCQTILPQSSAGLTDRHDLCVGRWIAPCARGIAPAPDDFTLIHDDGPNGHLPLGPCAAGFVQRDIHK